MRPQPTPPFYSCQPADSETQAVASGLQANVATGANTWQQRAVGFAPPCPRYMNSAYINAVSTNPYPSQYFQTPYQASTPYFEVIPSIEIHSREPYSQLNIQQACSLPGTCFSTGTYGRVRKVDTSIGPLAIKSSLDKPGLHSHNLFDAWLCTNLNHPNIVKGLGYIAGKSTVSIVMPYFQGSLGSLLESKTPIPAHIKEQLCKGISLGLLYMHQVGYLHGDIKPENILLNPDFIPVITDFGMSCLTSSPDDIGADAPYLAPELSQSFAVFSEGKLVWVRNKKTQASDIFTLGGVLFSVMATRTYSKLWVENKDTGCPELAIFTSGDQSLFQLPIIKDIIVPSMSMVQLSRPPAGTIVSLLNTINFNDWPAAETPVQEQSKESSKEPPQELAQNPIASVI